MRSQHELLLAFSVLKNGNWDDIYQSIREKEDISDEQIAQIVAKTTCKWVTLLDEGYPEYFKSYYKPPFVLFYEGNLSLLKEEKKIGVVGSRKTTPYGEEMTIKTCKELVKRGYVIVSGLARGIDSLALEEGIAKGRAIAFIGNGLDVYYPKENYALQREIARKGLLMSEYPLGSQPSQENFPVRNRLISYASNWLLVAQAAKRSGTLITAGFSIESGKDVFCFPYPANEDSACNMLIQQGAFLVESANDIAYLTSNSKDEKN